MSYADAAVGFDCPQDRMIPRTPPLTCQSLPATRDTETPIMLPPSLPPIHSSSPATKSRPTRLSQLGTHKGRLLCRFHRLRWHILDLFDQEFSFVDELLIIRPVLEEVLKKFKQALPINK
jgi:hypothetical protein